MVIFGFVPALHLGASLLPLVLAGTGLARVAILWLAPVILFLIPPLVVRTSMWPLAAADRFRGFLGSADFLHWWFTARWQVLFARLPALEELIKGGSRVVLAVVETLGRARRGARLLVASRCHHRPAFRAHREPRGVRDRCDAEPACARAGQVGTPVHFISRPSSLATMC